MFRDLIGDLEDFDEALDHLYKETSPVLFLLNQFEKDLRKALEDCSLPHESLSDMVHIVCDGNPGNIPRTMAKKWVKPSANEPRKRTTKEKSLRTRQRGLSRHYHAAVALIAVDNIRDHLRMQSHWDVPGDDRKKVVVGLGQAAPEGQRIEKNRAFIDAESALISMMRLMLASAEISIGQAVRAGEKFDHTGESHVDALDKVLMEIADEHDWKISAKNVWKILTKMATMATSDSVIEYPDRVVDDRIYWRGSKNGITFKTLQNRLTKLRDKRPDRWEPPIPPGSPSRRSLS